MLEKIIEIAKMSCQENIEFDRETSVMADMELSSLEFFQFICQIEDAFGIRISERELNQIDTLGDIEDLILSK
ncbi:hypothetical protein B5E84_12590 [Lachnoclostridium sp. An14]|uniref:acyl carrier protein n=1 Tax=Lachnoclostridium sp. An14 TaxID=1965562 RepID=UPI000B3AD944|nr:phosphopantetheine-binding protein [Lachnoclostridium sp. An14]OUQ16207.1 hypothetical protein B5E84_12590 [Lachnoclostridium sp. An14]